jgi:septum formation protein
MDKAGAYGIQEEGRFLVDRIEGNLDNVIGLPMNLLEKLAAEMLTEQERYEL